MDSVSGVGVLDKAVAVLTAAEGGARTLGSLVEATHISRATTHRLAVALEAHGLLRRDDDGRFSLGLRLVGLGHAAAEAIPGWLDARAELAWLREQTGESVQLFVRDGDARVCVESLEAPHELRTIVPVGARLPLDAGSGAKALLAGTPPGAVPGGSAGAGHRAGSGGRPAWFESVGERQPGVASVSAPIRAPGGRVVAALSVSGPIDRTSRHPGPRYGPLVIAAATRVASRLG